jgi:hypothetical protein
LRWSQSGDNAPPSRLDLGPNSVSRSRDLELSREPVHQIVAREPVFTAALQFLKRFLFADPVASDHVCIRVYRRDRASVTRFNDKIRET